MAKSDKPQPPSLASFMNAPVKTAREFNIAAAAREARAAAKAKPAVAVRVLGKRLCALTECDNEVVVTTANRAQKYCRPECALTAKNRVRAARRRAATARKDLGIRREVKPPVDQVCREKLCQVCDNPARPESLFCGEECRTAFFDGAFAKLGVKQKRVENKAGQAGQQQEENKNEKQN